MILDNTMADLVRKYGMKEVLASLCRIALREADKVRKTPHLRNKLNRVYEWYVLAHDKGVR